MTVESNEKVTCALTPMDVQTEYNTEPMTRCAEWMNESVLTPELKAFTNVLACKQYYTEFLSEKTGRWNDNSHEEGQLQRSALLKALSNTNYSMHVGYHNNMVMKHETSGLNSKLLQQTTDCFFCGCCYLPFAWRQVWIK